MRSSSAIHPLWRRLRLALLILAFGAPMVASAAVESIQIRLATANNIGPDQAYTPPPGKVLIIEHVVFSDYWTNNNQPKQIVIAHAGNPQGQVWDTTLTYSSTFNTLFRPIRIQSPSKVKTVFSEGLFIVFIYGLLVDEEDLYAAVVPAEADPDRLVAQRGGGEELEGKIEVASARPVRIEAETSTDLADWTPGEDVRTERTQATRVHRFALPLSPDADREFVRFTARAVMRDNYLRQPRRLILPLPIGFAEVEPNGALIEATIANGVVPSVVTEES